MMYTTLYLIPGVATDRRVFGSLDLEGLDVRYLDWIPVEKGESIQGYAARMAEQIDPQTRPVLLGYSFGGLVSIEMSKLIDPAATVIVSSIKHYHERPLGMFVTSMLGLNKMVPTQFGKQFPAVYKWMNEPRDADEHDFIETMAQELCHRHTDWAIDQALSWRNEERLSRLYHIHGTRDRIFPIRYIRNCIPVKGGSHLMLLNRGAEISRHLHRVVEAAGQNAWV